MEKLLQTIITAKSRQIVSAWEIEQDIKKQLGELQWEKKGGYEALVRGVEELVEKGLLTPIKASGHNGRVPPLSARYRRIRKRVEHPTELFNFRSPLDLSFYVNNLREFERYREILWAIDLYLVKTAKKRPEVWDTINERSFQLTGDEKFLASPEGALLLRRAKVKMEDLHCYPVPEPFFYRQAGDFPCPGEIINALIIENKDTFDTVCRLQAKGLIRFSPSLHLVIYGEGNKIAGSWPFLYKIEGTGTGPVNLYYFGDLDPEGIAIFCRLRQSVKNAFAENSERFVSGSEPRVIFAEKLYRLLLEQGKDKPLSNMISSSNASINPDGTWCSAELAAKINDLWSEGKMIPQEALSASYLSGLQEVEIG
ncbi:MAG: hypothetical protein C4554_07255 [Dethiobacter sp.]|nr:MAG: hypothetical protein C4554_07255 [Dethiobacter sp.]